MAAVLLVLLWLYETDSVIDTPAPGTLSCAEYKENINQLYRLIPNDTAPGTRCRMTPPRCGPTGLLFNPPGMQTYYYRSQCYHELALATQNEAHCADVIERKSLLFDGSRLSQQACRARVRQIHADRAAARVDPATVARIDTLTAAYDRDRNLSITLSLAPAMPAYGTYAIATTAHLHRDDPGTAAATEVTLALNASHPAISRDRRYARLLPIGDELLQLTPALGTPARLTYRVDGGQLEDYLEHSARHDYTLEVRLQFLESTAGALADPDRPRQAYISRKVMNLSIQ